MIRWAGRSSDEVGITVEHYPALDGPLRRIETIQVPGRNGDLLIDTGAYGNYEQEYDIYFSAGRDRAPAGARAVRTWLQATTGYQRLEDSYDPEFYRMAYYEGPVEIENIMNRFGRATISFSCKPQRWRKDGEYPITCAWGGSIYNSGFPALPLIRVNGTGAGNLYIGKYTVAVKSIDDYVMLDSDTQNAYKGTLNKNSTISAPEFPVLEPGENGINWSGGITSVEITPRWWTV